MTFPISSFEEVAQKCMLSESEDSLAVKARSSLPQISSLEPKIEVLEAILKDIELKLDSLKQRARELGLPLNFVQTHLLSLEDLKNKLISYFSAQKKQAEDEYTAIVEIGDKSVEGEKSHGYIKVSEPKILETEDFGDYVHWEGCFKEEVNWQLVKSLPKLEMLKILPGLLQERAQLIELYEWIRKELVGDESSLGLRKSAFQLRKKRVDLEQQKINYLKHLKQTMGLAETRSVSSRFCYLNYPWQEFLEIDSLDPAEMSTYEALKSLGVMLNSKIENHFRYVVVESYFRLKLWVEYCDFLELQCVDDSNPFAPEDIEARDALKIALANVLSLGNFFWGERDSLDSNIVLEKSYLKDLEQKVTALLEDDNFISPEIKVLIDQEHVTRLIEKWHTENFVVFTKQGAKGGKEKKIDNFLKAYDYSYEKGSKTYIQVRVSSLQKVDQSLQNQVRLCLKGQDVTKVTPLFSHKLFVPLKESLFIRAQKASFGATDQIGDESPKKCLKAIENTEFKMMQDRVDTNTYLAGFAFNMLLYLEKKPRFKMASLTQFKNKIKKLHFLTDQIIEKLPIGVLPSASLPEKLERIANYLVSDSKIIENTLTARQAALEHLKDFKKQTLVESLDRIRDYFLEVTRSLLAPQLKEIETKKRAALLKMQESEEPREGIKDYQIQVKKEKELYEESAKFAQDVYQFYTLVYSLENAKSLANAYLNISKANPSEIEINSLEILKNFGLKQIATSLKKDVEQLLVAVKTEICLRLELGVFILNKPDSLDALNFQISRGENEYAAFSARAIEAKDAQRSILATQKSALEVIDQGIVAYISKNGRRQKAQHLEEKIRSLASLDLRLVSPSHQKVFLKLPMGAHPEMNLWMALKKQEKVVLKFIDDLLKEPSKISTNISQDQRSHEVLKLVEEGVQKRVEDPAFFQKSAKLKTFAQNELIFYQFGFSAQDNFFTEFDSQKIAAFIACAYQKFFKHLKIHYQDDFEKLSINYHKELLGELEQQRQRLEEKSKELNLTLEQKRWSLTVTETRKYFLVNRDEVLKKTNALSKNIKEMEQLEEDLQEMRLKISYLKNATLNLVYAPKQAASILLRNTEANLEKEEKLKNRLDALSKESKELADSLDLKLSEKSDADILNEIESLQEKYLESPAANEEKISAKNEEIIRLKEEKTQNDLALKENEQATENVKEHLEKLLNNLQLEREVEALKLFIEQKALNYALSLFGMSLSDTGL